MADKLRNIAQNVRCPIGMGFIPMRFVFFLAVTLLVSTDGHAQQAAGIDRPVAEVRQHIGAMLRCNFVSDNVGMMYACGSRLRAIGAVLSRSVGAYAFDTLELDVLLARDSGKPTARERGVAQTTVEILGYVAPVWPDSRRWLTSAIEAADTDDACSFMKIDGVVISIRPYHYADREGSYAEIYVTRNFDIYSLCEY